MRRSPIDIRAKKYAPRQCVDDIGMHKNATCPVAGRDDLICYLGNIYLFPSGAYKGKCKCEMCQKASGGIR